MGMLHIFNLGKNKCHIFLIQHVNSLAQKKKKSLFKFFGYVEMIVNFYPAYNIKSYRIYIVLSKNDLHQFVYNLVNLQV